MKDHVSRDISYRRYPVANRIASHTNSNWAWKYKERMDPLLKDSKHGGRALTRADVQFPTIRAE